MHHRHFKRVGATALLAIAGLLGSLLIAPAAPAATINACQKKKGGTIRIVSSKTKCKKTEKKISWSTTGPAGKNGTNGSNGSNGTNGLAGTLGPQGPAGPGAKQVKGTATASLLSEIPLDSVTIGDTKFDFLCANALFADLISIKVTSPSAGIFSGFGVAKKAGNSTVTPTPDFESIAVPAGTQSTAISGVTTTSPAPVGNSAVYTYVFTNATGSTVFHLSESISDTGGVCTIGGWGVPAAS